MGASDDLQQGRLARAVIADDRVHFALAQLEVAVAECGDAAEVLRDRPGLEDDRRSPRLGLRIRAGHERLRRAANSRLGHAPDPGVSVSVMFTCVPPRTGMDSRIACVRAWLAPGMPAPTLRRQDIR